MVQGDYSCFSVNGFNNSCCVRMFMCVGEQEVECRTASTAYKHCV